MASGREITIDGFVRGMVRLPLSILERMSRVLGRGAPSSNHQNLQSQQQPDDPLIIPDEWLFPTLFEQQFGSSHPFFYACRFAEALKMAKNESKFVFVYLHAPELPHTAPFCRETLCSSLATEFLDANFISWGAVASRGEGLQMAKALKAASFPYCAVVAPASGDNISVLQQVEGPVSPDVLVEILQRTMEEQGSALRAMKAQEEEAIRENRRLREEQDAAYQASLQKDQEKDRAREVLVEEGAWVADERGKQANNGRIHKILNPKRQIGKAKEAPKIKEPPKETQRKEKVASRERQPITKILIRFPNGARKEQSFPSTDTIRSIYKFIDSLALPGIGSYRLISHFPRKVHGFEQLDMTMRDAGLHPNAAMFLELLK